LSFDGADRLLLPIIPIILSRYFSRKKTGRLHECLRPVALKSPSFTVNKKGEGNNLAHVAERTQQSQMLLLFI